MTDSASKSIMSGYEPLLDGDPRVRHLDRKMDELAPLLTIPIELASGVSSDPDKIADDRSTRPGEMLKLNRHLINCVAFTRDAKGQASFFSSLFKQEASLKQVGVVQEAKVFKVIEIDDVETEIGVAVRLQVEASEFSSETHVSIPNIAAEAQLGLSQAQMEISVRGFSGPLGDLLPAPESVNLTSYAAYLEAFQKIQKHVFSEASRPHVSPVVLGQHRQI